MKVVLAFLILIIGFTGCFFMGGTLYRQQETVVLAIDNPPIYEIDSDETAGKAIGYFRGKAGDSLKILGRFKGTFGYNFVLALQDNKEIYINRDYILTEDDIFLEKLKPKFRLHSGEDHLIWKRTRDYLSGHPRDYSEVPLEITETNLIKTKSVNDSTILISYIVTKVPQRDSVDYEIICQRSKSLTQLDNAEKLLAFYMLTGRKYEK